MPTELLTAATADTAPAPNGPAVVPSRPLVATRRGPRTTSPVAVVVVALGVLAALLPLLYLLSVSLMGRDETVAGVLWPAVPRWSNWTDVLTGSALPRAVLNSVVTAAGATLLTLALALPGAWAVARYRTGGRTLAATLLSPWLLPPIVAVVPLLTLLRVLGLNNTLLGLGLVYALVNVPVAVWLLEGFVRRLPREIEEAATVDGAGTWRLLGSVVAPLLAPALVAVGIIVAILNYNEYVLAAFLTQSEHAQTVPVALSLFYGDRTPHFGKIAAASLIGVAPVVAAAVVFQRRLVSGLTAGVGR